ncbi:MAG: hypothetical protein SXV54_23825 [Chloroflexota bacterium]|nr:hypothetical protein [Chloroflexota bacterium]
MSSGKHPEQNGVRVGRHLAGGRVAILTVLLSLGLLLFGCSGETTTDAPPVPSFDQSPLSLARPFFEAGYELVGYYELDADSDGTVEALAVLTVETPATESFPGGSAVLLFGQRGGMWTRTDGWKLDGVNASAELRDLTGDGLPELLVVIEEAETQLGDFVTPLRYTDHLIVFTYTPDSYLVELGRFSSSLAGVMRPRSIVGEWEGQPAIQTARDLPPAGIPLWWPFRVETFAWDGHGFASVKVEERQRISPVITWLTRRNAPWAAGFLALGGTLSLIAVAVAHRSRLQGRWIGLGLGLLLVAGGVGLGLTEEWLCVPALVLMGLAGSGIGWRVAMQLVTKSDRDEEK